jgi:succinyl-CoA synthetase beta subunit
MNIHEYQGKSLLKKYGVRVPEGRIVEGGADFDDRAERAALDLSNERKNIVWVVKAQIHAGGRGKAGGVKVCQDIASLRSAAHEIIGKKLVTPQTGPQGKTVHKIWIEEGCEIEKEFYLGVVVDRSSAQIVMMVSTEGGMEIEEVAAKTPEKIEKIAVDPVTGFQPFHGRRLAKALGLRGDPAKEAVPFFSSIYQSFIGLDCTLIEINPLVLTKKGDLLALDSKINFDDNASFRHPELINFRDILEENIEAAKHDLAFISLEGNIGCLVNGAGLAMATMDIIKLHGGAPANFLDVGGGASKEKVIEAFRLILKDPNVRAVLVNIFGGIMKCDIIADGLIAAARELGIKIPMVVRLEGTNVEKGKQLLASSGLKIIPADGLTDAAKKVVSAAQNGLIEEIHHVNLG